jgi:hypothetical protein
MPFFVNGVYTIIGSGNVPYQKQIQITQEAWDSCNADVQEQVESILATPPIPLLASSGTGKGIKIEGKGLEFHTQTSTRLQAPEAGGNSTVWKFTQCKKGWGH